MSLDIFLNKKVYLDKIKNFDLVVKNKDEHWLIDKYNNANYIKVNFDEFGSKFFTEFTSYGTNNPLFLLDMLVSDFQVKFITDNELENVIREERCVTEDDFNNVMLKNGYFLNDNIELPNRKENDYEKIILNTQDYDLGDGLTDEELPF